MECMRTHGVTRSTVSYIFKFKFDRSFSRLIQLYHSQLRITIERSFCIFVQRFGIYWKDLQYDLPIVCKIVEATYCLHNFAIRQIVPIPQLDSINSPEVNENNVLVDDM